MFTIPIDDVDGQANQVASDFQLECHLHSSMCNKNILMDGNICVI